MDTLIIYTSLSVGVLLITGVIITVVRKIKKENQDNLVSDDQLKTLEMVDIDTILEELKKIDTDLDTDLEELKNEEIDSHVDEYEMEESENHFNYEMELDFNTSAILLSK